MAPTSLRSTHKPSSTKTSKHLLKQIHQLENQIKLSQNSDLNPIIDLLDHLKSCVQDPCSHSSSEVIHALIYSLHRIFSSLIRQARIHGSPVDNTSEAVKVVRDWLKVRYNEYVSYLLSLLRFQSDQPNQIELDSLTILMNLVRCESDVLQALKSQDQDHKSNSLQNVIKFPPGGFESPTFPKIVKALLGVSAEDGKNQIANTVRAEFIVRYFNFCDDIRYRFLKEATSICQSYHLNSLKDDTMKAEASCTSGMGQKTNLMKNLLHYLESLTSMPTEVEELNQFWTGKPSESVVRKKRKKRTRDTTNKKNKIDNDGSTGIFDDPTDSDEASDLELSKPIVKQSMIHPLLSLRAHQKIFQECWVSFLSLDFSEPDIKRVLNILHHQVIPHMTDPKILMDFLVDCLDHDGTISILSLNALFTLISKHNLDYPDFYTRLYTIVDSIVLHTRHRPRFFRMLEVFLSSTHLPVNIIASFVKRLARLSLFAPPGAIITIVPFSYNLIKQHPNCMAMLHRSGRSSTTLKASETDPFNIDETDPMKTNAISSSLWEFVGLRSHYLASVSTLFKVFQEAFDKPKYDLEDFLDHTYSTLIQTEFDRLIKKPPALSIFALSSALNSRDQEHSKKPVTTSVPNDIVNQIWNI